MNVLSFIQLHPCERLRKYCQCDKFRNDFTISSSLKEHTSFQRSYFIQNQRVHILVYLLSLYLTKTLFFKCMVLPRILAFSIGFRVAKDISTVLSPTLQKSECFSPGKECTGLLTAESSEILIQFWLALK